MACADLKYHLKTITGGEKGLYRGMIHYPVFEGNSKLVILANLSIAAKAEEGLNQYVEAGHESFAASHRKQARANEWEWTPTVCVARDDLISVYFETVEDDGKEPFRSYREASYGLVNGKPKELEIADLFAKEADAHQALSEIVIPKLKAMGASHVVDGTVKEMSDEMMAAFVLTPTAISFLFKGVGIASSHSGLYTVKVPYTDLSGKLDASGPLRNLLSPGRSKSGSVSH